MTKPSETAATRLNQLLTYQWTQMIHVVVKLGIPDLLVDGPRNADELAATVGAHPRSLYRLLRALASRGIFIEDAAGRFGLTPLSELLRSDVPGSFRPFALSYGEQWWWNAWGSLLQSVRTGETAFNLVHGMGLFEYLDRFPEAARIFYDNMTSMTASEAQAAVNSYDFSGTHLLVDVGSGHGALTSAILLAYPGIHAIAFDLPAVIEGAQAHFQTAGLADRCEVRAGSFFDSIPPGGDTYTLKDILHDWDDEQALAILRNCHSGMGHSARLLVIERVIPPGNEPMIGKLIDINMLVLSGGRERTQAEYRVLLEAAGFNLLGIFPTQADISILEAVPL